MPDTDETKSDPTHFPPPQSPPPPPSPQMSSSPLDEEMLRAAKLEANLAVAAFSDSIRDFWEPRARQADLRAGALQQQLLRARAEIASLKRTPTPANGETPPESAKVADLNNRLENLHSEHRRVVDGILENVDRTIEEMRSWREDTPHPFKSNLIAQLDALEERLKPLRPKPPPV